MGFGANIGGLRLEGHSHLRAALRSLARDVSGPELVAALLEGADPILDAAIRNVPRRTGKLASTLEKRVKETRKAKASVTVESASPVAHLVELGTRPHVIKPKAKKALAGGSLTGPVGRVQHPGTSGKPYLRPAFDANEEVALKRVGVSLVRAIKKHEQAGR